MNALEKAYMAEQDRGIQYAYMLDYALGELKQITTLEGTASAIAKDALSRLDEMVKELK